LKADGSIVAWGHNGSGECNVPEPNTYFVAIAAGGSHSLGIKVNSPPIANFTFTPQIPTNTTIIHFTDTSTDSDGTIASWSWSFGDGGTSTLQNPTHQYANGGTYSVMLTVTDDDGASDSISKNVAVISLDQSQTKYTNNFAIYSTNMGAQSFIPTMSTLSYVEVFMRKVGNPPGNLVVSIRSSLTGADLVSLSIPPGLFSTTFGWVKFDFSDISVTPGNTYYLVLKTSGGSTMSYYNLGYSPGNLYKNGALWTSYYGQPWFNNLGYDLCFKTYGI
jgi:PKD repeat protein